MREFFPDNRVEYFVSYYDYYQPEAYIASQRHVHREGLVDQRRDRPPAPLGHRRPAHPQGRHRRRLGQLHLRHGQPRRVPGQHDRPQRRGRLRHAQHPAPARRPAVRPQRRRARPGPLPRARRHHRGAPVVRGDGAAHRDVRRHGRPAHGHRPDHRRDAARRSSARRSSRPPTTSPATERMARAMGKIEAELQERLAWFEAEGKLLEAQRLRMRTQYDLEMMGEVGYCNGIENYSMHIDGRDFGEPPFTLLDYFPDDFLLVIDESHQAVPQLHGQYEGDRSRKDMLVEHGFRLPSARDNRPLHVRGGARADQPVRVHVGHAQRLRAAGVVAGRRADRAPDRPRRPRGHRQADQGPDRRPDRERQRPASPRATACSSPR